jgi:hypothetical protein
MGQLGVVLTNEGESAVAEFVTHSTLKAFQECGLIVAGAIHPGNGDLIIKGEAAVCFAKIKFSMHGIAAAVAGEA